jgi:hypothetical protein
VAFPAEVTLLVRVAVVGAAASAVVDSGANTDVQRRGPEPIRSALRRRSNLSRPKVDEAFRPSASRNSLIPMVHMHGFCLEERESTNMSIAHIIRRFA